MSEYEFINKLSKICVLETVNNFSNLPMFVYSHNNKYFDIFNSMPVFNILNLEGIKYEVHNNGEFFLYNEDLPEFYGAQILNINNKSPEFGLSEMNSNYCFKLQKGNREVEINIKYPSLLQQNNITKCKLITKDTVYYQIVNFKYVDFKILSESSGKKLYIDLRNNGGGQIENMINVLDLFFQKGQTMFMVKSTSNTYKITSSNTEKINPLSVFLIVNEKTASSAEIFSMSLKNVVPVTIMGRETEGKWYIHKILKYKNLYIKTPIYNYISEDLKVLHNQCGIIPDINYSDNEIEQLFSSL